MVTTLLILIGALIFILKLHNLFTYHPHNNTPIKEHKVCPGDMISLHLDDINMTVTDLSHHTGMSKEHIQGLIVGISHINNFVAHKLANAFPGTTADYWLALEYQYSYPSIDLSHEL